jgi:hypothetical protein
MRVHVETNDPFFTFFLMNIDPAHHIYNLGCTLLFVLLLRLDLDRHSNLCITRNTAYY